MLYWAILLGLFGLNFLPSISRIENLNYGYLSDRHYQMPIATLELDESITDSTISDDGLWFASRQTAENGSLVISLLNLETFDETFYYPKEIIQSFGFSPNSLHFAIILETKIGLVDISNSMNYVSYNSRNLAVNNLQITNNGKIIVIEHDDDGYGYDAYSLLSYNESQSEWNTLHYRTYEGSIAADNEGSKYVIQNSTGVFVFEKNGSSFEMSFNTSQESIVDENDRYRFICNGTLLFSQGPILKLIKLSDSTFCRILYEGDGLNEDIFEDYILGQRNSFVYYDQHSPYVYMDFVIDFVYIQSLNSTFRFYPISSVNNSDEFDSPVDLINEIEIQVEEDDNSNAYYFEYAFGIGWYREDRTSYLSKDLFGMPTGGGQTYFHTLNLTTGEKLWWATDFVSFSSGDIFFSRGNASSESKIYAFDDHLNKLFIFSLSEYGNGIYDAPKFYGWQPWFTVRLNVISGIMIGSAVIMGKKLIERKIYQKSLSKK